MSKKIEFSAKNAKPFNNWLKKFSKIDNALLLEVDEVNQMFLAKVYNEERSVVKFSTIKFDVAGFTVKSNTDPKRIKVGIYNISRLMKTIDQFNDVEFAMTINYGEIEGEVSELAGLSILFKNKDLKMNVECTSLNIFKYISDDLFTDTIAALDNIVSTFKLSKVQIEQTNSLCSLDNEYNFMEFKQNKSDVYVAGKTFDLLLGEGKTTGEDQNNSINIFKEQFDSVDIEDYNIKMGEDRLVFTSDDATTVSVISMVEKDD